MGLLGTGMKLKPGRIRFFFSSEIIAKVRARSKGEMQNAKCRMKKAGDG